MESINYFIDELTDEENLAAYYEETFIIDDIDLTVSPNGDMLIFTLHDIDQNILEKSIHPSELSKYIVGINIINSVGAGRKKNTENAPHVNISPPTKLMLRAIVPLKMMLWHVVESYADLDLNL